MSRKIPALMAAMLMMAAAGGGRDIFDVPRPLTEEQKKRREQWRKERAHKLYGEDRSEREFVINGEAIMAHDRKTALKIYANRHPEQKSKKRKK